MCWVCKITYTLALIVILLHLQHTFYCFKSLKCFKRLSFNKSPDHIFKTLFSMQNLSTFLLEAKFEEALFIVAFNIWDTYTKR